MQLTKYDKKYEKKYGAVTQCTSSETLPIQNPFVSDIKRVDCIITTAGKVSIHVLYKEGVLKNFTKFTGKH